MNSRESIDSKSAFRSSLESAFHWTKAGCRVCSKLSDLLSAFSLRACENFVGAAGLFSVVAVAVAAASRKTAHFRYASSAGEPYRFQSRFHISLAVVVAAVNPITTTAITYCFIAGSQLLTRYRSPIRYRVYIRCRTLGSLSAKEF